MKKIFIITLIALITGCSGDIKLEKHNGQDFCVAIKSTAGDMNFLVNAGKAPVTAQNFLDYINARHYDGTIFHRVIENFMIQGGGHTADMTEKPTRDPIINEANNGLSNSRGTIAMAREMEPHSAGAQFYINHKDNPRLDYVSDQNGRTWGYAVFGEIITGEDVLDSIAATKTDTAENGFSDVPVEPITIKSIRVINCPE